ncbi:MAG: YigZ family protein, partial [Sneathia sanguinegens]
DIYNVVLLAVRYFGGIKLGAGGLIRNYARVAKELVDICTIKEYEEKVYLMLIYDYSRKTLIDSLIEKTAAKNIYTSYLDKINTKILVAKSKIQNFDINEVEKIIL